VKIIFILMKLLNRKAVEGLPLKYVILVLVAAIALALILDVTGILKLGIFDMVTGINNTLYNSSVNPLAP